MEDMMTLAGVRDLAHQAHEGQVDKVGVPYFEHVQAVAAALTPFGTGLMMAGYLHDVIEDTDLTMADLHDAGVPPTVCRLVSVVSKPPNVTYEAYLHELSWYHGASLIKAADNAHNSNPARLQLLDSATRTRLQGKYRHAREIIWPGLPYEDVFAILTRVNTSLLPELQAFHS